MFLNIKYLDEPRIPKGKPKCIKPHMLTIKKGITTLIEQEKGTVWFNDIRGYYWGLKIDVKQNQIGIVDRFATIGSINIEMMDRLGNTLTNEQEELLHIYLKVIGR